MARNETVRIESIGAGGDGVGHLADGRVAFVPRTAPGDLVDVRIVKSGTRWVRAFPLTILEPGRGRREPPCPFADQCGGCALEHLEYDAQLEAKAGIVADALTRIGKLEVAPPEVVASPRTQRYRNRASFSLRRIGNQRVVAGFRAWDDPGRIVDVDGGCLLFEEPIARVWDSLRTAWGEGASLLPRGRILRLTLRSTVPGAVSLLIEGGEGGGDLDAILGVVAGLESIWIREADGRTRHLAGAATLEDVWQGVSVPLGGAAFTQVNRTAAELLERHIDDAVGKVLGARIIDAYAGAGLRALRWARQGARSIAIELDPDAIRAGEALAQGAGVEFHQGRVEHEIAAHLPADVVVLNPPRDGLASEVPEALRSTPPERLVYISCDPATLARDLRRLESRFRLISIRSFDLFPQTAHVETVVAVERL